jgi:two-component sensor histidine kinase
MLDIDRAVPCGLIVNELLVNAFKYAFEKNAAGRILVSARKDGSRLLLSIADDGIGLPPRIVTGEQAGGLGLTLVKNLVQQLRGRLEFDAGIDGRGTTIRFDIPLE